MARFGFFTDSHVSENRPIHRVDDYIDTVPSKIERIYDFAHQNDFEFMTFGGDLCDRFQIFSYALINRVIKAIDMTTYACIGEHDLCGHSPDTFKGSALSFICNYCENLKILWKPVHLDSGISLYAKHEWETMGDAAKIEVDPSRFNVLICHELLYNKKMPFGIVNTHDLDLQFDLVCSGDLHCGYEPHKVKNTWYCNPGSMIRKTTADAKRMPKFLMIDAIKGKEPRIREVEIPTSRPGKEVLNIGISETVRKMVSEMDMGNLVKSINETTDMNIENHTDIHILFDEFKNSNGVPDEVLKYYKEVCERMHLERKPK